METTVYILKIITYFIYVYLIYMCAKTHYAENKFNIQENNEGTKYNNTKKGKNNISRIGILLFALLFGLYSSIVSVKPYASDRQYYAMAYGNDSMSYQLTKGYNLLSNILYNISDNPDFLFFSIGFIIMFIILCVYRKYSISSPLGLLLLLLSLFFIYDFHLLKQGLAIALGTLSIMYILKNEKLKAFLFIALAFLFHESALILIPIELILIGSKRKGVIAGEYALLIFVTLSFSVLAPYLARRISLIFPSLESEMGDYFNGMSISLKTFSTALKGIPVYIITILSIMKRKKFVHQINNYDKYVMLSAFTSVTYLLSAYMYWMYRFGLFFMFFVCMFFAEILKCIENKKEKRGYFLTVYGSMGILTVRYLLQMFFNNGGF